jgi:hypothetical protein
VVDPATGAISGTPAQSGAFTASIRAANTAGLGAAAPLAFSIAPAPTAPAITSAASASGQVGVAFTYQTVATPGPITSYAHTGTLPAGLSFNSATGAISGSPTQPGGYMISLTATGDGGTSTPQSLAILINPAANVPVVTSPDIAIGNVGVSFSYQIEASNAPHITLDAINVPPGLAVNPFTGKIEGTPTVVGTTLVSLVGTNAAGTGPTRSLSIIIGPALTAPVMAGASQVAARVGESFSYQMLASGSPTSFEVVGAPAWMVTNTLSGEISGTPTAPGTVVVLLIATNSAGASSPKILTISVAPAANTPVITSSRTPSGKVGVAFPAYTITATPAAPAVTAFLATGLPPGLSLDSTTGIISGTPTKSGDFPVTVSARNSNGVGAPTVIVVSIAANITFGNK